MIKFIILFCINLQQPVRVNVSNINYFYPKGAGAVVVMQNGTYFDVRENPQHIDMAIAASNRLKFEDIEKIANGYMEFGTMSQSVKSADFALTYFPSLVKLAKAAKIAIELNRECGEFFQGMTDLELALSNVEAGLMAQ